MATTTASITSPRLPILVMIGLLAGPFLSMLDSNIVNVALPAIAKALHTDLAAGQWVLSGYLLALAVGLPASAFLAKRFGTRRVYFLSLLGFTLASLACAGAPTLPILITTRALQGLFGAPLVPLAMNVLLDPDGATQRGGMPAAAGILLFLAPALGPTVGGLLLNIGAWPLIFLINVPFGVVGMIGAWQLDPEQTDSSDRSARFDPLGLLLLGAGLALATYGATAGAQHGWFTTNVWPTWGGGAILLLIYLLYAFMRVHPAVDLKLLRHPQPALAIFIASLAGVVMFAMLFLIPIYLQQLQGATALVAGLVLLPQGLVTGLGMVLGNTLSRRWGARWTVVMGMVVLAASTALLLLLDIATPAWFTAALLSGRGLATGLAIQPLLFIMITGLNSQELADGNTLFNVAERLSGSVGIALLATFFQQQESQHVAAVLAPFHLAPGALQGSSGQTTTLPPGLRQALAQAVVSGLHDTIFLLVIIAGAGSLAALLVHDRQQGISAGEPQRE